MTLLSPKTVPRDVVAGLVVFLVALPLCLGVALASNAPLFSGILAGIIGGVLVGFLSGSSTSVAGPAAGLTAVVATQIGALGSFRAFLLAVVVAGVIQIVLGVARTGFIAEFFPSSVIKGLLAAIGVILILKQLPHVVGHDPDPLGDMAFNQADQRNTFSEIVAGALDIQPGAALVGILSIVLLVVWEKTKKLKASVIPAPLVVVLVAVGANLLLSRLGGAWAIEPSHLVAVPVAESLSGFANFLQFPDFAQWTNPAVYRAAVTIAIVASLETLLNLEAVDKIDPEKRSSPPNRELLAQGIGNMASGLIGGLPITSVIVRSSVNINAGGKTKLSTVVHGLLLLLSVALLPMWLNKIPLAALAAILLMTGFKLASPKLLRQMWSEGRSQFLPFIVTVVAIVLTDLLVGILIGLAISVGFILHSNLRRPLRRVVEKHIGGDVLRIELANQVSFLNRASLAKTLAEVPRDSHVLIDARNTDYIDADVRDLISDFSQETAPAHGVELSLLGFKDKYQLDDRIQYVDLSTREVRDTLTPERVLEILMAGNERFRNGQRLTRDFSRMVDATAGAQYPMAVVLSCIDSRTPAEILFDLGLGDVFSVRIAGNIAGQKVLGSMEFACSVAGAKLVLVMGHTSCGAVKSAVELFSAQKSAADETGCKHLDAVVSEVQKSIDPVTCDAHDASCAEEHAAYVNEVARRNVERTIALIRRDSETLDALVRSGQIDIVGGIYDVRTGLVEMFRGARHDTAPSESPASARQLMAAS